MKIKILHSKLLLFFISITFTTGFSQNERVTDLLQQADSATHDSIRVYANQQLGYYYQKKNQKKALEFFRKSLSAAERLNDSLKIANIYYGIGFTYRFQQDLGNALENYLNAVRVYKALDDDFRLANTYMAISDLYINEDNIDKQSEYLNYTEELLLKLNDSIQLSGFYNQKGVIYDQRKEYDSALFFLKKGLKIANQTKDKATIGTALVNLGLTYKHMSDSDQALLQYEKALKIFDSESNDDLYFQSVISNNVASVYAQKGNFKSAEEAFLKSLNAGKEIGYQEVILQNLKDLANLYEDQQNYAKQAEYLEKHYTLKDSIFTAEKQNQLSQLESDFVLEKKDLELEAQQLEIEKKKQQNTIYIILICFSILVLLFLLFYFMRYRKKNQLLQSQNTLIKEQKTTLENTLDNLKATQQQLIQSEKMASLGELTAGIAHEIQNPLNFVNNFSEVSFELLNEVIEELDKGDIDEAKAIFEDVKQNLEKINYHGKRADSIVKGMLQHSRTNSGEKEETNINKLTDEYMRLAYHGLRAKDKSFNATLETDFDENIKPLKVISQDIGRVLLNLFTNAYYAVNEKQQELKAHGETDYHPTINATTSEEESEIIITVKDNGNGIPKESINKIFQPFFTTKPTGQGTGLGLSMSYDIIKNHGGELKVKTQAGKFTAFEIHLPK